MRAVIFVALAVCVVACSKKSDQAASGSATSGATTPASSAPSGPPPKVDCAGLVTAADVADVCKQTLDGPTAGPMEMAPGCDRTFQKDDSELALLLVDYKTAKGATSAVELLHKNTAQGKQDHPDKIQDVQDAPGVGDAAFAATQQEIGSVVRAVHVAKGRWGVTISTKQAKNGSFACEVPQLEELAKRAASRLP